MLRSRLFRSLVAASERIVPPSPAVAEWLRLEAPDVVFASPVIVKPSPEVEYVKAARALNIPTVVAVASWDNLTTKGTFHVAPDRLLVWNERIADEAVVLHGIPRSTIEITGAPTFDFWFENRAIQGRAEFFDRVGLDPERPMALYVCSSAFIVGDETQFVLALQAALDVHAPDVQLLVRPHPLNAGIWEGTAHNEITLFPRGGDWPDDDAAQLDYLTTMRHSAAVIGINTSAFVEAAIADRPCVTVTDPRFHSRQFGLGHFAHLTEAGYIEAAADVDGAARAIASLANGADPHANARKRFVATFVRPRGLALPVASIVADAIAQTARRRALVPLRLSK